MPHRMQNMRIKFDLPFLQQWIPNEKSHLPKTMLRLRMLQMSNTKCLFVPRMLLRVLTYIKCHLRARSFLQHQSIMHSLSQKMDSSIKQVLTLQSKLTMHPMRHRKCFIVHSMLKRFLCEQLTVFTMLIELHQVHII
jgi:hypothetical protein